MLELETDVVILGAGFAGLSCARRLAAEGVDFQVLEARDRIGGRAWSHYDSRGVPSELGALMIHGRRVVTHQWVREAGLHIGPIARLRALRLSVGQRIYRMPWMMAPFHPVVGSRRFYNGLVAIPRSLGRYDGPGISLAKYLDTAGVRPPTRTLVELNHAHIYAADPDEMGILGPAEETRAAPAPWDYRNYKVVEGYSELARRMGAGVASRIRLRTAAREVSVRDDPPRVEIRGTSVDGDVRVRARHAVITVPLGVLKSGLPRFDPPLPERKRRAIERVSMADAFTIQLRLRGGTLGTDLGTPAFLWGGTPSSFFISRSAGDSTGITVAAFTVGREARRRVDLPDADVIEVTLEELRSMLPPKFEVGTNGGCVLHRWQLDPFSQGAYSYLSPTARFDDRVALSEPVEPALSFAGEATHCLGASATVHGAIETGERAAEEVLDHLRAPEAVGEWLSDGGSVDRE